MENHLQMDKERLYRLVGLQNQKRTTVDQSKRENGSQELNQGSRSRSILEQRLLGDLLEGLVEPLEVKRHFVLVCLETLGNLSAAVPQSLPPDGIPVFGLKDLRALALLTGIITIWGLGPSLVQEGIQLGFRSLEEKLFPVKDASVSIRLSRDIPRLFIVCTTLSKVIVDDKTSSQSCPGDLMLHHHMIPTLAAFLLLVFGTTNGELQEEESNKARDQLERLIEQIPLTSLFTALLALYGRQQAPQWLRKACGYYLSQSLTKKSGTGGSRLEEETVQALSMILLSIPKQRSEHTLEDSYFDNLTKQLRALLTSDQPAVASISGTICLQLLSKYPDVGQRLILEPVLQPCMTLIWSSDRKPIVSELNDLDLDENPILVSEETLETSLLQLQCLLIEAKAETQLTRLLAPAIQPLYFLYQSTFSGTSGLKEILKDLMTLLFGIANEVVTLDFLKALALNPTLETINVINGSSGGNALSWSSVPKERSINVDVFMELLGSIERQDVIANLFLAVLELTFGLLEHDAIQSSEPTSSNTRVFHINLILAMMNKDGAAVLRNIKQVLTFIKNVFATRDVEILPLGLALLVSLLSNEDQILDKDCHFEVEEILVYLREQTETEDTEIKAMVAEVQELIIARKKPIDEKELQEISNTKFLEAIKSLGDPLLPIRAYGLSILRTMVLCKDPTVIEKIDLILTIFLEQLQDSDSFIYLNAVKGLATFTDVFPMETLKTVVQRYADEDSYTKDYRLRIGEVMMDTIERSGTSFLKHGTPILESICKVLRDEKKEMRASAMSCLATISQTAPLSLLPFLYQLMDYFTNLLIFEKSVETRRASLFNFAALIQGLDAKIFSTLPRDILNRMQVQLEYAASSDEDSLSRSHAQTALDHMNALIFDYLELREDS